MNRRAAFAALLATVVTTCHASGDDFDQRCIDFNHVWGEFFRLHFGCKPDETDAAQCKPYLGKLALKEFEKAGKIGRKLWPE